MSKEKPIIEITSPEIQIHEVETFNDGLTKIETYNYDNSHLIYRGCDLGTFEDLTNLKRKYEQLREENESMLKDLKVAEAQLNLHKILVPKCKYDDLQQIIDKIFSRITLWKMEDITMETARVLDDLLEILKGEPNNE